MKTYKCDRCGERYQQKQTHPQYYLMEKIVKKSGNQAYAFVDLCPGCYCSLLNWIGASVSEEAETIKSVNVQFDEDFIMSSFINGNNPFSEDK